MDASMGFDFEITTSIRSDGILRQLKEQTLNHLDLKECQFYMLSKHQDRMLAAISAFKWPKILEEKVLDLEEHLHTHLASTYGSSAYGNPLKIRVTLSSKGDINIASVPVPNVGPMSLFPLSLFNLLEAPYAGVPPTFRVFLSPIPTTPDQFTAHKSTRRTSYDGVRCFLPPYPSSSSDETPPLEILLVNHAGQIMEGSFTTPYFHRGGKWITPAGHCGGNLGTTRRYALERGLCEEGVVVETSVYASEKVVLSNGARGFGRGIVEELPM